MDARRIAEIRELAATWLGPARADLIALCDLAAEAVAYRQAIKDYSGDHDDDERALRVPAAFIRRQAQRYLSNPKSERRG